MSMTGLMLAGSAVLPYHVMRCAAAAGVSVHVLGSEAAQTLQRSRACAGYHRLQADLVNPASAVEIIRSVIAAQRVDVIFPSDDASTRLLISVRDQLGVPTSALPDLGCFDLHNDKWAFNQLCVASGVSAPQSWLFPDSNALADALRSGALRPPLTLKPVACSGGVGICHILSRDEFDRVAGLRYSPILAQRHIVGQELGVNVLCDRGRVQAIAVQQRRHGSFRLIDHAALSTAATRVAAASALHGPANLDAIIDDNGTPFLLESNPRFWYTIYMSMVLGLNFVDMSIRLGCCGRIEGSRPSQDAVRLGRRLYSGLLKPWQCTHADWRMVRYHLGDPIPYAAEKSGAVRGGLPPERSTAPAVAGTALIPMTGPAH